jgi:hypothetical protein
MAPKHVGYVHEKEVDAIRFPLYTENNKYWYHKSFYLGRDQEPYDVQILLGPEYTGAIKNNKFVVVTIDNQIAKITDPY